MIKLDELLYDFLVEESGMPTGEFRLLTEEVKAETVIHIANDVLQSLQKKINDINTFSIDKTRGDIKNFNDLSVIQDVITKLTGLSTSFEGVLDPNVLYYLKEITKAIYNLNKYANYYKDAYRSKKTIMIMSYQSVILSIISVLSYLVSALIDFKDPTQLKLKQNVKVEEILPMKSIIEYNKMINNGSYDTAIRDVSYLREFYTEYSVSELSTIYEAVDIISMINNGISAFSNAISNKKITGVLFKALGIVMLILSFRDIFYTLSNSRTQIVEKLNGLKTFLNPTEMLRSNTAATRFITFNNKNAADAVYTSDAAKKEISDENKEIIIDAKNAPSEFEATSNEYIPERTDVSNAQVDDIFANFNF